MPRNLVTNWISLMTPFWQTNTQTLFFFSCPFMETTKTCEAECKSIARNIQAQPASDWTSSLSRQLSTDSVQVRELVLGRGGRLGLGVSSYKLWSSQIKPEPINRYCISSKKTFKYPLIDNIMYSSFLRYLLTCLPPWLDGIAMGTLTLSKCILNYSQM